MVCYNSSWINILMEFNVREVYIHETSHEGIILPLIGWGTHNESK